MSTYLKLSTMEYPRFEGDIRLDYPEITEDQTGETFPCPPDYVVVKEVPPPTFDANTQCAIQSMPIIIGGAWTMVWNVIDWSQEDINNINQFKEEENSRRQQVST